MKPIRVLHFAPPGLAQYVRDKPTDYSWTRFRDEDQESYIELREALSRLQHGLCGYCEQSILKDDCQVEHVLPRSSNRSHHLHDLTPTNLIASCKGGSARNFYGPDTRHPDPDRFGDNSCGQAKGETLDDLFLDPRTLPKKRSLFKVNALGQVFADEMACQETSISECRVERTIEILGLGVERLRRARERRWNFLNESYSEDFSNSQVIRKAAEVELMQDKQGNLQPFFTTNRSYFMPFSDEVLTASEQIWV